MIPVLPPRMVAVFVLAMSTLALTAAFVAEFGFGLRPCVLCLTQRVPFAAGGLLAGLALLPAARPARKLLLALAGVGFLVNAGVAVYHVGVEQKWWASSCVPAESGPIDVTDLAAAMSKPVEARCDEPAWEWNGITIATLNIPFSAGLGLVVLALVRRMERKP